MNSNEFREFGQATIEMIVRYREGLREQSVLPSVEPGYLKHMIPKEAPDDSEHWQDILADVERVILPGVTHWQSPHFHAYYPTSTSYPSMVGELLSAGLGIVGFSWITSPACTELEVVVMDWLGKLLNLPKEFLNSSEGPGGGVLQGSASETTFLCLLAAKDRMLKKIKDEHPTWEDSYILGKMVAYSSDQSNSSVEKAGLLASIPMRLLKANSKESLTGEILQDAITKDRKQGLIPIFVCATLGTTATCSNDELEELGLICRELGLWLHVDAAYAGSALICPEYKYLLNGVELVDSFNFNPHKWLLVNFDCSALWVKDSRWLEDAFNVDRIYLKYRNNKIPSAPDYRHWQIPLGRRFRSLKLWFTLRSYGTKGLQDHVRTQIQLAEEFENHLNTDSRFNVLRRYLGLVCFQLQESEEMTQKLLDMLTMGRKVYLIAGKIRGEICARFVVCSPLTEANDITYAFREIQKQATVLLDKMSNREIKGLTKYDDNEL